MSTNKDDTGPLELNQFRPFYYKKFELITTLNKNKMEFKELEYMANLANKAAGFDKLSEAVNKLLAYIYSHELINSEGGTMLIDEIEDILKIEHL